MAKYFLAFLISTLLLTACNSDYSSKKAGYFKIEFPEHTYREFDRPEFPYRFEYPTYANIIQDSTYFDDSPENPYWINIEFPQFHAKIFLSYKIIGGKATYKVPQPDGSYRDSLGVNYFDNLVNDAFTMTNKNNVIAPAISDSLFTTENHVTGIYFTVAGNAATANQFFMSDTTKHFIRGALYFHATPNADSLRPVHEFLRKDIKHLIHTFEWK